MPRTDFGAFLLVLAPIFAFAYAAALALVPTGQLFVERIVLRRPVRSRLVLTFYLLNAAVASYLVYSELSRSGTWHYVREGSERGWIFLAALTTLAVHGWMSWRWFRAIRPPRAQADIR